MKRSHKKANAQQNGEWAKHVRKQMKRNTAKKHRRFDDAVAVEMLSELYA